MVKKLVLPAVLLILCLLPSVGFAEISVGVKKGDWIEYDVTATGNPPAEHNVIWSRIEVAVVQGSKITVNVTSQAPNGEFQNWVIPLDLSTGQIGAWWIIPKNMNPGDQFYDGYLGMNITINREEEKVVLGSTRTITNATLPNKYKLWDKATGVFVESGDNLTDYSVFAVATSTNMWGGQAPGLDNWVFYVIVLVVVAVVAGVILVAVGRRKRKQNL